MPSSPARRAAGPRAASSPRAASGKGSRARKNLDQAVSRLQSGGAGDLALADLILLAEHAVGSLQEVFGALDASLLREFDAIASSIARVRADISSLQPGDLSEQHIPAAGRELAAVVEATEDATHRIMEAAERMLESDAKDLETYRALVETEATAIFEACSFQDITGQRVSKVVGALEDIDERVGSIANALGADHGAAKRVVGEREAERARRRDELIVHGPALEGGVAQDDIDQILNS